MSPAWAWTTSCLVEVDASLPAHGTGTAGQRVCLPQTSSPNEFGHSASIRRTFWSTGSGWRAAAYTSKTPASRFLPAGIVSLAARNSVTEYVPSISTNLPPKAQILDFFFTRTGPNRSFRRTGPHKTAYFTTRECLRPPLPLQATLATRCSRVCGVYGCHLGAAALGIAGPRISRG